MPFLSDGLQAVYLTEKKAEFDLKPTYNLALIIIALQCRKIIAACKVEILGHTETLAFLLHCLLFSGAFIYMC